MITSTSASAQNALIVVRSMRRKLNAMPLNARDATNCSATYATKLLWARITIKAQKLCATMNQIIGMISDRRSKTNSIGLVSAELNILLKSDYSGWRELIYSPIFA